MTTSALSGSDARSLPAASSAPGDGSGKPPSSVRTPTVHPRARNPSTIRRSYPYPPVSVWSSPGTMSSIEGISEVDPRTPRSRCVIREA
jgi:hypothetical protein